MPLRVIKVGNLARVEGEGGFYVRVRDGRVEEVRLHITEPPRFFEAFLRGRTCVEAPDLVARICGICPVSHQLCAVLAVEQALGIEVDEQVTALRRLLHYGEWIESHALHVFMLHAPDYLGYDGALEMARDYPDLARRGFRLRQAGNAIITLLGGRAVHPVNLRVGGFYRVPAKKELLALAEELRWAREAALATVAWAAALPIPEFAPDYEFVALHHPGGYAVNEGNLVSSAGLDIAPGAFEEHFVEEQVPYSHALQVARKDRGAYVVGPLARYNLNFAQLSPPARDAARQAGLLLPCRNPFQSILVRSVEILHACEEALWLIEAYEPPARPAVACKVRAGVGQACVEAPRGTLYHRYRIDERGVIQDAKIVTPTAQNQKELENDLRRFVVSSLSLPFRELARRCEQLVRCHDPCISCATHSLRLDAAPTA